MDFQEYRFRQAVSDALVVTQKVLGTARTPSIPEDVHHKYDDKYALAEAQLSACVVSTLQSLQMVGLNAAKLRTLVGWAQGGSSVTLRFQGETTCAYVREVEREVESPKSVTDVSVGGVTVKSISSKIVTKVTDYYFEYGCKWSLTAYRGTGREQGDVVELSARASGRQEIKTGSKGLPYTPSAQTPLEVPITWLLKSVAAEEGGPRGKVSIDRAAPSCHTPRRNKQTGAALDFGIDFVRWTQSVSSYVQSQVGVQSSASPERRPDARSLTSETVLVPALLFEKDKPTEASYLAWAAVHMRTTDAIVTLPTSTAITSSTSSSSSSNSSNTSTSSSSSGGGGGVAGEVGALMDLSSVNRLLAEAFDGLSQRCASTATALPAPASSTLITGAEAAILIATHYVYRVLQHAADGVGYIELMLRTQLCAAIGKVVGPADFDEYMRFHARRLFRAEFEPRPLCFSVRRSPAHTPEGVMRINAPAEGDKPAEAIFTVSARGPAPSSPEEAAAQLMSFPLSAETNVQFGGERHLHAWLAHKFTGDVGEHNNTLNLSATSRQFSSYILLVGKISSSTTFEPISAVIIKDKDEIDIPLALSELPTPKEFKDAIASLSPEQQRFAKAFRAMQLESTLFGVLVLHIKPQLEVLLNLIPDSLTKEVELTQDLMDLFIKYQIPSDLLSGPTEGSKEARIAAVKGHVKVMQDMIQRQKSTTLENRAQEYAYAQPSVMFGGGGGGGPPPMPPMAYSMAMPSPPSMAMSNSCSAAPMPMSRSMNRSSAMPSSAGAGGPMKKMAQQSAAPPPPPPSASNSSSNSSSSSNASASTPSAATATTKALGAPDATTGQGEGSDDASGLGAIVVRDLTKVPTELDAQYEALDTESALHATIIKPEGAWTKKTWPTILSTSPNVSHMHADEQKTARNAAFDLIDALSRSGGLVMKNAALHVIIGATHRFDQSLMDTVIQDNINPIERTERSLLIMATTLHQKPALALVRPEQVPRLTQFGSGALFPAIADAAATASSSAIEAVANKNQGKQE